ncbi:MAG: hypothetical protein IKE95_00905 [Methanobrevibacter sp.]|nr:hypothetical protein [Methanobrevibacter sp.]
MKEDEYMSDFEIKDKRNKIDECYGLEEFVITEEEIKALQRGKKLYTQIMGGEYAITIELAK